MRRRDTLTGLTLAVLAMLLATILLGLAGPAGAQTPATPTPTREPAQLPISVTLGTLTISLDLPLTLSGLLGRPLPAGQAPEPPPAATTTQSSPAARPTPTAPPSRGTKHPTPAVGHAARLPSTTTQVAAAEHVPSPRPRRPSSPTPSKPTSPRPAPVHVSARQQLFHPSLPIAVLLTVVCLCGAGTAFVVRIGGRRKIGQG